jgi:hypothetical protein
MRAHEAGSLKSLRLCYKVPFGCSAGWSLLDGEGPGAEVAEVAESAFSMGGESIIAVPTPDTLGPSAGKVFKTAGVVVGLFPPEGFAPGVFRILFFRAW